MAFLIAPSAASAQATFNWTAATDGNWNDPANWTLVSGPLGPGYPSQPGDTANFSAAFVTADRAVIVPGAPVPVEVTLGVLNIDTPHRVRIGSGFSADSGLIFDNGAEPASINRTGSGASVFNANIKLASNLRIDTGDTGATMTFGLTMSEIGGSRNIELSGDGRTTFENTASLIYTGSTTVLSGTVSLFAGPSIPGDLIVGDDIGEPASAKVISGYGGIFGSIVRVFRDGDITFVRAMFGAPGVFTLDELFIRGGQVVFGGMQQFVTTDRLTMEGGHLAITFDSTFSVTDSITASSIAPLGAFPGGRAFVDATGSSKMQLFNLAQSLVVADGPEAIDAEIAIPIVSGSSLSGLDKIGPGVAVLSGDNTYRGETIVAGGTLLVNGNSPSSNILVNGGRLGGIGTVGELSGSMGTVAPGMSPGALHTGAVRLPAGLTFEVELNPGAPDASDRLDAVGAVNLDNPGLTVIAPLVLSPAKTFTIISNDGTDPIGATFAGLDEGATVTAASGATFRISYVGGDGNDVVLTNITPVSYFLSEGATGTFFDEDVLIANPNTAAAPVTLTFLLPDGGTVVKQMTVAAQSRVTVKVDEIEELEAASASVQVTSTAGLPLAVERTMFWDSTHYAGHTANAVDRAGTEWHFAEGAQGFFNTYLLLANAGSAPTDATVTFLRENEAPVTETVDLPAFSRVTLYAGDYPALVDRSFGMTVTSTLPITAERSMYFQTTPTQLWSGGHVNAGTPTPSLLWFHPEGATGSFFSTFILISNPQAAVATVTLTFMLPNGETIEWPVGINPQQRVTINPAALGDPRLENAAFSTFVISDRPVVSERAMYWPKGTMPIGEGHASSGATATAMTWDLAEGRSGGPDNYATYILLANPAPTPVDVSVTFLRESGAPVTKVYTVPGTSRYNIDVGVDVPELADESFGARVTVTSGAGIAVERSMYWNANGIFWSGGTNALGSPLPH